MAPLRGGIMPLLCCAFFAATAGIGAAAAAVVEAPAPAPAPTAEPSGFVEYINATADVNTECKTCPRTLCPNTMFYEQEDGVNVTCWTRGTKIMGDNMWLRTDKDCYITQYDISEYDGDYTEALPYCGRASEREDLTLAPATIRYKAECRVCPTISCDVWSYLREDTDVDLTCWTADGQVVIDDPYWLKTTKNCYVSQKHLYEKPDLDELDWCGPIPLLEIEKHWNENGTSEIDSEMGLEEEGEQEGVDVDARGVAQRDARPEAVPGNLAAHYLINVTVGEDFANCHAEPSEESRVLKRYVFNQEVWLQCITERNGTYWSETIDFCYVRSQDFWESPEGDFYRNPSCELFEDPDEGPGDGDEE